MVGPEGIRSRREFAEALTGVRVGVGLTVRQVAVRAGAGGAHSTVGDWFSGRGLPSTSSRDLLVRVLRACGVVEAGPWLEAWQRVRLVPGPRPGGVEPYRGLASFDAEHAEWFFGREALTAELVACVRADVEAGGGIRLVVGASGSGKSSLLRAGLVPAMSPEWTIRVMAPGPRPVEELERAGEARVLVVDQFEELFTAGADDLGQRAFVEALRERADAGAVVVIGLRADFYGQALSHPELVAAVRSDQLAVGPMTRAELRRAIVEPARRAGFEVDDGLVEVLLVEAAPQAREAAVLPLLSHVLYATWRHSTDRRLTVADYRRVGGVHEAVAATADDIYESLDEPRRELTRRLFLSLVSVAPDIADTRRRVDRAELVGDVPGAAEVLDRFVAQRLVTADEDSVRLGHEALLWAWPLLRGWLDNDRASLVVGRRLGEAAAAWHHENRDPTALYRGTRLAVAEEWVDNGGVPGVLAAEFLRLSVDRERAERQAARRRTRRLRRFVAGLLVLVLLTAAAVAFALDGQRVIRDQRDTALAGKVANEAVRLRAADPASAAHLALASYRVASTVESRSALLSTSGTPYARRLTDHTGSVRATTFTADGTVLATASLDGTIRLWEATDPHHPASSAVVTAHTDGVTSLAVGDGLLVSGGADRAARLWDIGDPRRPRSLGVAAGHEKGVTSVALGGHVLATGSHDGTVRLWDVTDPLSPKGFGVLERREGTVRAVFSPDGRTLAVTGADGVVALWDLTDPAAPRGPVRLTGHTDRVLGAAFSPDGTMLASGSFDNTVRLWDVASGTALGVLTGHGGGVAAIAFGPDGHTVATGSYDLGVALWDVSDPATPSAPVTLAGHAGTVYGLAFGPDGRVLASGSDDGTARLWDLRQPVLAGNNAEVNAVAFSPDGRTLVGGSYRTSRVWDVTDPHAVSPRSTLVGHTDGVLAAVFAPGGTLLATASLDGTVRLWDLRTATSSATVEVGAGNLFAAAFSPDGRTLAVAGEAREVHLLDVSDPSHPEQVGLLSGHTGAVSAVAFAPDGRTLATASRDRTVRLWDVAGRTTAAEVADDAKAVAFAPDGRTLATGGADHSVRLRDVGDPTRPPRVLVGHTDSVAAVAFSPDGRTLASGSGDHTARLWDVASGAAVASLSGHTDAVYAVAFAPDGRTLATGGDDATVRLWDTDVDRVASRVCVMADPPLDRAAWDRHFPNVGYRPPCP
ncbi:hypothetical protein [Umezawaea tangerina]|uniref:WD40 repeat protein n=1 Tax=Umezawaea tangerina TaxID=84725 RepID=A0A2T0T272_9PSEU|nr:hypothetical protein [Umezawaea tangerina]PRY39739.1 WD40 repeat protein [Umezawaea tangerina]